MVKLSHDEIIERLDRHGLRHRTVSMSTEGAYLPTDVDWNNKDVLHRNHVHSLIDDVLCVVEEDLQAAISLQTILGMRVPLVLVHYDTGVGSQTHFLTLLAWTMVTRHEFVQVGPNRTRATTTYTIAGNRFWMAFFPLIRLLLRVNYRKLMAEDVPMRERRGLLRSWGYTFDGDEAPRDIRASLHIDVDNVRVGADADPPEAAHVAVADLTDGRPIEVGRSDHLGLTVRLDDRRLVVHPRLCGHDGADLSAVEPTGDCLVCPWHGRRSGPLATFDVDGGPAEATTLWHRLSFGDGRLSVGYRSPGREERVEMTGRP